MRFLHLCLDEKFIVFARKAYDAAWPGASHFLVYRADNDAPRTELRGEGYEAVGPKHFAGMRFKAQLAACERFVIHYLDADFVPVVARVPEGPRVIWHAWGADIYPLLGASAPPLFLPETARLVRRLEGQRKRALFASPGRLCRHLWRKWQYRRHISACLARLDTISMSPAEFALLQRARPELRAGFRHFHYSSIEDVFTHGPIVMQGRNILLGNSADPSNNHLEALAMLAKADLAGRAIVCPLSYGGNEATRADYVATVIAAGRRQFGNAFMPLEQFMPFDEYAALLSGCGTVVMNHVRQQAVGTIGTALYNGASVYLRPENLVAGYFRDLGCKVFDLAQGATFEMCLEPAAVTHNRDALAAVYAFDRVVDCLRSYDVNGYDET